MTNELKTNETSSKRTQVKKQKDHIGKGEQIQER